ncbi:LamG domain-containing protein [Nonomuraea sp. NPDC049709]|uniref:LamG domain-containing protein n=1 Tax=Nonomuraea sp. NPDC049709 TaxID=3154736 RepID=UPI003421B078
MSPRHDNTAYVRGDARLTGGRYGKGLALDKVDDGVEVPYTPAVDVEDGDFTAMTWFRYNAATGSHTILSAYRINAAPQMWLLAEPASNRIRAFLGTGLGTAVTLESPAACNDGAWHHIALQRIDRLLTMYVDGAPVATGTTPPGSVTNGREFGVHGLSVGQRLAGANQFLGTLDEFRLYGRALTAEELSEIRTHNVPIAGRLRLPFETIDAT